MRFVVLSDTHGEFSKMFAAVDYIKALGPDAVIFLGDLCSDARLMEKELKVPFHIVSGNCDAGMTVYPSVDVVEAEGVRILLCHGHQYDVYEGPQRLIYAAQERECTVALYGHTHRPELIREEGILIMNPGSLCRPRISEPGLGVLIVEKGSTKGLLLPYHFS